jgi:oxygen-dependent protoporphyrinogen oxidase
MRQPRVVIAGGGITGLSAAYRLQQLLPNAPLTLVEADTRLGGKILTERTGGFVVEAGPDSFLASKPRGIGLCRELGLESHLQGVRVGTRRAYVLRDENFYELPEGLTGLIPAHLGPMFRSRLISPMAKARLALDYVLPPARGEGDESLAAFIRRRLGREVYDRLVEPLMSGIYAGDGEQLSLAATYPQLHRAEREHGSVIRGVLAARAGRPGAEQGRSGFLTPVNGVAEIVEALAASLNRTEIRLGKRVKEIVRSGTGYQVHLDSGESLAADALILATPAYTCAEVLDGLDEELASCLRAIPHVSTATISLAYRQADVPRPLDTHGYLIPRVAGKPILACTFTSVKFAARAPQDHVLIRAFVGRAGQEGILDGSDESLISLVQDELRQRMGITAPPILCRVFRWPRGMPQYTLGHLDRLARIERRLAAHPGLYLAGNAYHGVGIPDCIASGEAAAVNASTFLSKGELLVDHEYKPIG